MFEDYKGDSATYKYEVFQKSVVVDITGWKILAQIGDDGSGIIKKATANVTGGSDDMILITDATKGEFEVYIDKGETTAFTDNGYIETAVLIAFDKDTLTNDSITFITPEINWESI